MTTSGTTLAAFTVVTVLVAASVAKGQARDGGIATSPVAHAAATCSEYPNQKTAQEAADTRDADGDGIYCEDLLAHAPRGQATEATTTVRSRKHARGREAYGDWSSPGRSIRTSASTSAARCAAAGRDG